MTATLTPANIIHRDIVWMSSSPNVASVTFTGGRLEAHMAGTTTIRADSVTYAASNPTARDSFNMEVVRPNTDSETFKTLVGFYLPANHPVGEHHALALTSPLFFRRGDMLSFEGLPTIIGDHQTGYIELGFQVRNRFGGIEARLNTPVRLSFFNEHMGSMAFDIHMPDNLEEGNYFLYVYRRSGTAGVEGIATIHIVTRRP